VATADLKVEVTIDTEEFERQLRHARSSALLSAADVFLTSWLTMYTDSIFPEPEPGRHGSTVDACSARALRWGVEEAARKLQDMARRALRDPATRKTKVVDGRVVEVE
jgi:hypothetical protein